MRYGHLLMSLFCAWVLWEEKAFLTETTSSNQTDILGSAYATREDCDATLQRFIREDLTRGNPLGNPQVLEWRSKDGKLTTSRAIAVFQTRLTSRTKDSLTPFANGDSSSDV